MKGWLVILALLAPLAPAAEERTPAEIRDEAFLNGSVALLKDDYAEALRWFRPGVEQGDPRAKASLGFLHFNGWGVEKNLPEARRLYEESAQAGCHQGLNNLAHLYRHGLAGLPQDKSKARGLLERAAKAGNEYAMMELAHGFINGEWDGKPQIAEGLRWLEFAGDRGVGGGLSDLGFARQKGIGGPKDAAKALELYRSACVAGSAEGASNLGYLYHMGDGVPKSPATAAAFYQVAIAGGSKSGKVNLAVLMRDHPELKIGVPQPQPQQLLREAADAGSKEAAALLEQWKANEATPDIKK